MLPAVDANRLYPCAVEQPFGDVRRASRAVKKQKRGETNMKRFFCILLAALLLLTLAACSKAPEADRADEAPDWQAQYDLGVRYLSEGNYEEAILAFEAAIEIDPRNADAYLKLAQVCEQREDYAKTLQTLEAGLEQTDDQRLREYIWQVKVSLLEKPGAIEGTALNGTAEEVVYDPSLDDPYCEVVPEGYTRSVLLALDDVTPAVFRFVRSEFTLHRYCVLPDGQIEDTAYQMELGLDYCSCAELMLYYNERMGAYCCAYLNDISLAYTGINGYYATTYILDDTGARLYRRWDQVWLEWDDEKHRNAVSDMSSAGWPYLKEEIMNRETLPYTYWMFKCESWISGGESAAEWRYSRRYWTAEELEAYEKEIRGEPRTPDFSKKTAAQPSDAADDANTKALLTYIDTLPYDTIADSARKLVDAYADMLNSTDSGEGIFYPDETDANRFWTAIYNYEIDQRGYLDADDVNYWMYKGYRMDSRQNVQDVANAMYGHIVELPPRDYVSSYCPKDSDTCYYFGIGDRGAVQVALDGFERSEDGSAVLKLSYSYPMDGLYMTALAKLRVNPNVNLDGEIPFYYMIESVEIRYA
jgi:tetratricopeptide (TPR) repeat protein